MLLMDRYIYLLPQLSCHYTSQHVRLFAHYITSPRSGSGIVYLVRNVTLVEDQHHESLYLTIMLQGLGAGDGPLQAGVRGELLALGLARLQEQGGRDRDQGQRGLQPGEGRS